MTAILERTSRSPGRGGPRVRELDWLMLAVLCLACFGLVMAVSIQSLDYQSSAMVVIKAQGAKLVFGVLALLVCSLVPMTVLRRYAVHAFAVGVALVYGARLFGPDWNHAHRWISVLGYSFQPVDLARVSLIVVTAWSIARAGPRIGTLRGGMLAVFTPAILLAIGLFLQPDKGNALLVVTIALAMGICAGLPMRWLLGAGAVAVPALAMVVMRDGYAQKRVLSWWSGELHPQVAQSLHAIELGGATGEGVGAGWRKMGFVPEAQNDFVFAIVGEELGLLGSVLVLAAFTLIGVVGCRLCLRIQDPFHRYLVFGCTFAICAQALINLLVATGTAPAKGIDLPFVSGGGTNLMAQFAAIGLIGNAARSDAAMGGGATSSSLGGHSLGGRRLGGGGLAGSGSSGRDSVVSS